MKKSTKPILRLLCALAASWVGSTAICCAEAQAQTKPATTPAAPAGTTTYSFYQGIIFQPYPGTIPRAAVGSDGSTSTPAPYPIVEVPTPGLRQEGTTPRRNTTRRKISEETLPPVKRKRRVLPAK
jgi:hypothetical protein